MHRFREPALRGDFGKADAHDFADVAGHEGRREHGGDEHFAVDAVLHVRNAGIPIGQFGRLLGPARHDPAEHVRANLRTDPFAVGVAPGGGLRGPAPIHEVPVCHRLGGVEEMEGHAAEPGVGHVARGKFRALTLEGEQAENGIVHVVVPGHELNVVPGAGLQARRNRPLGLGYVVVQRQRAGGRQVVVDAFPRPAFHRLAQGTAGRPA